MKSILACLAIFVFCTLVFLSCNKAGAPPGTAPGTGDLTYSSGPGAASPSNNGGGDTVQHPAGVLTSGEWNDNEHWDFWLNLMSNDTFNVAQQAWGFSCTTRWSFTVQDAGGRAVTDAVVNIMDGNNEYWACHTNKFGIAQFVPVFSTEKPYTNLSYQVVYNNVAYNTGGLQLSDNNITCKLPVEATAKNAVDIMFVVDATGSMGDEIEYLKNELYDVLNRMESQLNYDALRYAAVFYRDRNSGDAYITRPHDFTTDKNEIVQFVNQQNADGGGDTPEAVDEALDAAMQQHWSPDAKARIMFLILDAPPHDAQQNIDLVHASIQKAAEKGIIIIPVGASGIDKPTEFLMRFIAIATNGTYTFLTNDSGIGNAHITPTVGPYTVEYLNDQMVRLITKYAGR